MFTKIAAFIQLIRWPNLVFIALTQVLFGVCIVQPIFQQQNLLPNIHGANFWLVVVAYLLIAAAGYIINDYFDLNIDQINKPNKVVVSKIISRRWVIIWHLLLTGLALAACYYVSFTTQIWLVFWAALINSILLFFYSTSLKKKFLIGNIVIAAVIAWGVFMYVFYEYNRLYMSGSATHLRLNSNKLLRIAYLYAGFSFIISIIREVVKDMEDIDGDRLYGCKTLPIVWGINAAKVFVAVWLVVLMGALILVQTYVIQYHWWFSIAYSFIFIIYPLFKVFKLLIPATNANHFGQISNLIKWVMFSGIVSMVFFIIYQ
ncbi:MAG: geranylgeranylglycerol-phosphate geranylgeranyltransferase [Chitinophagaceae bacterium]